MVPLTTLWRGHTLGRSTEGTLGLQSWLCVCLQRRQLVGTALSFSPVTWAEQSVNKHSTLSESTPSTQSLDPEETKDLPGHAVPAAY